MPDKANRCSINAVRRHTMDRRFTNEQAYDGFTRFMFFVGGAAGLLVSYIFSVRGFGAEIPGMVWAARGIVLMFIALQMYVNRQTNNMNMTLMIGGLVSYGYGIYTNIVGILSFAGLTMGGIMTNFSNSWWLLIIPITVGIPLEIVPEALIVMSLFPESRSIVSDALRGLFDIFGVFGRHQVSSRPTVSSMRSADQRHPVQNVPASLRTAQSLRQRQPIYDEPTYHTVGESGVVDDEV